MMMSNDPNVQRSRKITCATLTLFYLISSHLLTELTRCSSIQSQVQRCNSIHRSQKIIQYVYVNPRSSQMSFSLVSTSFSAIFSSSLTSSTKMYQWVSNRPLNMMLLNAGRYYLIMLSIRDSGRTPLPIGGLDHLKVTTKKGKHGPCFPAGQDTI
ncbi:hypothetical protein J3R30DRAFT_3440626 [Lentinula aciculospora]|uniref:Uncharacterized protein n=1 Tax=Lentinula aciculospora TaxID=153920 RepID=A0A9W9ALE4_9AGAR|nr:hypothetical protein J3R30DRAFT_3440626 [Lentinula aciculospora]